MLLNSLTIVFEPNGVNHRPPVVVICPRTVSLPVPRAPATAVPMPASAPLSVLALDKLSVEDKMLEIVVSDMETARIEDP